MKKTFLAILLMMATVFGYSQLIAQPGKPKPVKINIKSAAMTPESKAFVPDSYRNFDQGTVVYARIENGDTTLIVNLPELDIDLMSRYFEITETRQGRRLVNNVRKVYPYAKLASDKSHDDDGKERHHDHDVLHALLLVADGLDGIHIGSLLCRNVAEEHA